MFCFLMTPSWTIFTCNFSYAGPERPPSSVSGLTTTKSCLFSTVSAASSQSRVAKNKMQFEVQMDQRQLIVCEFSAPLLIHTWPSS